MKNQTEKSLKKAPSATATSELVQGATATSAIEHKYYAIFMEESDRRHCIKTKISKKKSERPKQRICHCGRPFFANRNDDSKSGRVCSRECYFSQGECSCAKLLGGTGRCFCGLQALKK